MATQRQDKRHEDGSISIVLLEPVFIGDDEKRVEYQGFDLSEPLAWQLEESGSSLVKLISIVGKIPLAAAKKLKARDYRFCSEYFDSFL